VRTIQSLKDELAKIKTRRVQPKRSEHGRKAAVFDESTLMWSLSAERARREFVRSIALATALFDWVVVYCATLKNDVERLETEVRKTARDRLTVRVGRLASDP
jgi:hypothetical protein